MIAYKQDQLLAFLVVIAHKGANMHNDSATNSSANNKVDIKNLPDLLTVREVADLLRVSPLTIKRWGKRGKLPAIRINARGDRRYRRDQVLWMLGMVQEEDQL